MTRETKIGLLVGLAFIIVIGILLSDHMTSTTQPPQAQLADAAPNVLESVTAPAPARPTPAPLAGVPPITPSNPVLTPSELQPPAQQQPAAPPVQAPPAVAGVSQIEVGGPVVPQATAPIAIRSSSGAPDAPSAPAAPVTAEDATAALVRWAQGTNPAPAAPAAGDVQPAAPVVPVKPVPAPITAVAKREYVAQPGDSLSRIAARLMGANTKANRDAIVAANPSLQKNPDIVVEGRKYVIPQPSATASTPAPQPPAPTNADRAIPASAGLAGIPETVPVAPRGPVASRTAPAAKAVPVTELVEPLPAAAPAGGGGYWYVVRENDNLWKIAAEQLGSGNAWLQIKELNKDVLKGAETVQPNMRLRLPAKPLASASAAD